MHVDDTIDKSTTSSAASTRVSYSYSSIKIKRDTLFGTGFTYHTHRTNIIAVSPDGKWVAFGGWDETIQMCEIVEGGQSWTYRGHKDHVRALAWSPDGKLIASASTGEATTDVQVWDASSGQLISQSRSDQAWMASLAWSSDSSRLAFGTAIGPVHLLNALTGETQFTYQRQAADVMLQAVAWSPDDTRVASAGSDGSVHVWQTSDGADICRYLGHYGGVNAVAWSPDGTAIVSGGDDGMVQVWNASTREPICTYQRSSERIRNLGWSLDGQRIRVSSWENNVQEIDAHTGTFLSSFSFPMPYKVNAAPVAWNRDATTFAMGIEDRRVAVADARTGKLWLCRASTTSVELLGESRKELEEILQPVVLQQGRSIRVWGTNEREVVTYHGHTGTIKAIAWSPDGTRIASGGYDGTLQLWDAANGKSSSTYRGHIDPVVAVAWSPDGQNLLSGSLDTTVKIWDVATGQPIADYHGHSTAISALAWSPQSNAVRIASSSKDGFIQIWDREKHIALIYRGHHGPVEAISWSPDGKYIASGGEDKTIQVWDATTGETLYTYSGHTGEVMSVAWSPDGTRIASSGGRGEDGARDKTSKIQVWEAFTGNNPVFFEGDLHHLPIPVVIWSPDSRLIATGDLFGQIKVHDAATGEAAAQIHLFSRNNLNGQQGQVLALAWSPDGQRVAASFSRGSAFVYPTH